MIVLYNLFLWDPGYVLLEYISRFFGLGIYGVNTLCAILFLYGFLFFVRSFNIPLSFALFVAFPYIIMVVVNGYSRQGVAVGFAFSMLGAFYQKKIFRTFLFYFLAILFHKTALISGVIFLSNRKFLKLRYLVVIVTISIIVYFIFKTNFEVFWKYYLLNAMHSSGGMIRILVNVLAATILLIFTNRWKQKYDDFGLWSFIGLFSIFVLFFTFLTDATTVGDRILLYFYPLQIVVFYRTIFLIKDRNLRYIYFLGIVTLYWAILLIWLNFATHRFAWIPYDNLIFRVLE